MHLILSRNPLLAEDRFETGISLISKSILVLKMLCRNPLLAEDRFETYHETWPWMPRHVREAQSQSPISRG